MKRREFSIGSAALLACAAAGGPAWAQNQGPEAGTHFLEVKPPVPVGVLPGKVEVIEFFWYSCPHCNAFEPRLRAWLQRLPADVVFRRVPVAFRDDFVPQQRLFYTLEAMGKIDDLHGKVFQAIHGERQAIDRNETILAWAEKQGLDRAKFQELFSSFGITAKVKRATQIQEAFKVQGVPSLGIAGRFYTDGTLAGGMERALVVTDYLILHARKTV